MKLNARLDKLMRGIEESWLGPWKCLLLSEPLDSSCLDSVIQKMSFALKCKFDFYANESLLRVVLGDSRSVSEMEECSTHLLLRNGCLTKWGSCPGKKYDLSSTAYDHAETHSGKLLHQLILEAIDDIEAECISREPIILDLDSDVQILSAHGMVAHGISLVVNPSWTNHTGEWHVGCKLVYELFTSSLTSRLKKERKKKWDEKNQEAIVEAVKNLDQFDQITNLSLKDTYTQEELDVVRLEILRFIQHNGAFEPSIVF